METSKSELMELIKKIKISFDYYFKLLILSLLIKSEIEYDKKF